MNTESLLFQLGLALAIGLLVGTERHWREREEAPGARTAGIRTFGITGLLGGLTGAVAQAASPAPSLSAAILAGAVFLAFSAVLGLFKWRELQEEHDFSVTSVVAGQATFLLGCFAVLGDPATAGGAAIALTVVLASRETLHAFVARLTWPELRSAIFLLAMAFIVLPLLPNHTIDPFNTVNPAEIWVFAIALAGVSFVGYAAVRLFGTSRGPLIAGIAGGLVSSTAVALTSARDSVSGTAPVQTVAAGALAASAVSVARGIVLVMLFAPAMLSTLLPALAGIAVVLVCAALVCAVRSVPDANGALPVDGEAPGPENPFEIGSVLKLAAVIAFATVAARVAAAAFGDRGTIVVSVIMGLVDIDSVILSITRLTDATLSAGTRELAILAAITTNIIAKMVYSVALGSRRYGLLIAAVSVASLVAGALVAAFTLV
ncbi:MgtC/SapB family protein [Pseudochelatococcus lubricantis]|uniref:MgtC/SapB family protein n=1 Tax=Pseudochelatococcus lubricantis TaxID=1538102 RepID=UPI0035E8274E